MYNVFTVFTCECVFFIQSQATETKHEKCPRKKDFDTNIIIYLDIYVRTYIYICRKVTIKNGRSDYKFRKKKEKSELCKQ